MSNPAKRTEVTGGRKGGRSDRPKSYRITTPRYRDEDAETGRQKRRRDTVLRRRGARTPLVGITRRPAGMVSGAGGGTSEHMRVSIMAPCRVERSGDRDGRKETRSTTVAHKTRRLAAPRATNPSLDLCPSTQQRTNDNSIEELGGDDVLEVLGHLLLIAAIVAHHNRRRLVHSVTKVHLHTEKSSRSWLWKPSCRRYHSSKRTNYSTHLVPTVNDQALRDALPGCLGEIDHMAPACAATHTAQSTHAATADGGRSDDDKNKSTTKKRTYRLISR